MLLQRVMKRDAVFGGAIVAMSSTAGVRGGLAPAAFTASQHAVIGLTQQAAAELAPAGIRINCVSPTILDTVLIALLGVFLEITHLITCLIGRLYRRANSRQLIHITALQWMSWTAHTEEMRHQFLFVPQQASHLCSRPK